MITAILLSYKRKPNMPLIVESLRSQTVPVEIWLINNNGLEDFGADRLIAAPWNAGEWARYVMVGRAKTEYCMFQDDDFMLGDKYFLEDALSIHGEKCPDNILGTAGRGLQPIPPHYWPDIVDQDAYANILKGHFQLFKTDVVRRITISKHFSSGDIPWALDIGSGRPVHWVSQKLARRLDSLDRYGVGLEFRPGHYAEREAVAAQWVAENTRVKERGVYA